MTILERLRNKTEREWVSEVMRLPMYIRPTITRLIWWDFFSLRLVPERWAGLDAYLKFPSETQIRLGATRELYPDQFPRRELVAGLMLCGYPQEMAERRVKSEARA